MAVTSVPSSTAPARIARPIPAPRKKPPKTDTSNLSSVIIGYGITCTTMAKPAIAIILFIKNLRPICQYPSTTNGMLIRISNIDNEIPVLCSTNSDIPVTPPSIKLLGNKKLFKPKLADATPRTSSNTSVINCLITMRRLYLRLPAVYLLASLLSFPI